MLVPRPSGRVLLIDSRDRLLLLKVVGEFTDYEPVWITPGGGLKPGESYEDAALRELYEETGLEGVTLGPCVWIRNVDPSLSNHGYKQVQHFFPVRVHEHEAKPASLDPGEEDEIREYRWWSLVEIERSNETFAPRRLGELLPPIIAGHFPTEPIDSGF